MLRFVGENPSDAEVQVEKLYLKFETDNLQYFNTDWTGPDGKITQKCFYLLNKTVGLEITNLFVPYPLSITIYVNYNVMNVIFIGSYE